MGVIFAMADQLKPTGLATAADMLRAAAADEAREEAEQLSLLPALPLGEARPAGGGTSGAVRRGPGRPKGAKNRSTEAWTEFLLSKHRSPLEVMASVANRSLRDLKAELEAAGFTVKASDGIELLKLQLAAADRLAPYLHQKQPTAIQAEGGGFALVIGSMGDGASQQGGGVIDLLWAESEEYQEVSGEDAAEVEQSQSNGSAQAVENARVPSPDPLIADQSDEPEAGR